MTTSYTLTGDFNDLLGEEPRVTGAWLETNLPAGTALVDLDANKVLLSGPKRITLDASNTFSISLIATNSTGTNVTDGTLRYRVRAQYSDGTGVPRTWESGFFDLTAAADLSDKVGGAGDLDVTIAPSASLIDAPTAANVTGPSQTRTALDAAYVRATDAPYIHGSKNGLKYDGTDETTTLTTILDALSSYGGGTLVLEGVVRCDGQINLPTTSSATQVRQAPLRITGTPQNAPGSVFTGTSPYPAMAGLDLRYAGRTDAGCTTTLGSAVVANPAAVAADRGKIVTGAGVPDQAWILAVEPGVGWTLSKGARATGTVSLTSFGGRIQGLGYGTLEIDHVTFQNNGTASSAPFGLTTGPRVRVRDCVFLGHSTKGNELCDEDPWVFGGPGQGTALTSALTSGVNYTTLAVDALPVDIIDGRTLTIGFGTGQTQTVTINGNQLAGATTITVDSFTANANYAARTGVYVGNAQKQETVNSWSVPSAPFQGYSSRIESSQFYRIRRIVAGLFTTDLYIDNNAWMHNCGSNLAQTPSTLTTALASGATVTSLAVTALDRAVIAGDVIQVGVGDTSQEFTAAAAAAAGATAIDVVDVAANATYAIGTKAFNRDAGLGAMVESFDHGAANTVHVHHNRMGFSGGYNYATRYVGGTVQSVIDANNFQDVQATTKFIAGHRFDLSARFNLVIPGLLGSGVTLLDDRSNAGVVEQTVLHHDQSKSSRFPQGITLGSTLVVRGPSATPFILSDSLGNQLATISGAARQWNFKGSVHLDGNSTGAGSTALTLGNNSTTADAEVILNPPTGRNATLKFQLAGTNRWQLYNGAGNNLFLRDMVNALMAVTFTPGASGLSKATFDGEVRAGRYVKTAAAATASRPTGLGAGDAGATVFDTTLGKPIWWNGTGWVDSAGVAV